MYCCAAASQRNAPSVVAASVATVSLTEEVRRPPRTGTIHCGRFGDATSRPAPSRSWNFTGTVLPALNTLVGPPAALIGWRKPLKSYSWTWYLPDLVVVLPALSFAV